MHAGNVLIFTMALGTIILLSVRRTSMPGPGTKSVSHHNGEWH
jgi:hypothetical protein